MSTFTSFSYLVITHLIFLCTFAPNQGTLTFSRGNPAVHLGIPKNKTLLLHNKLLARKARIDKRSSLKPNYLPVDVSLPWLSDDELMDKVENCRSEYPSLIYYNRVPKCASSSLLRYIDMNSKYGRGCHQFLQFSYDPEKTKTHPIKNPHRLYIGKLEQQYRAKEMLENAPAVFDSHTAFLTYFPVNAHQTATGYGDISYINVLRDPLARLISLKKYLCKTEGDLCNSTASHLFTTSNNRQITYLCGHQPECKPKDEISLYIAKVNLVQSYSVVGISERLGQTTNLLRKIFPKFFTLEYDGVHENSADDSSKPSLNAEEMGLFREYNNHDIELYNFATKVFEKKLSLCGIL